MKIRTDFVTNSSSANYILEIDLIGENEKTAAFSLAVSPETCFSDDGDMTAEDISLTPIAQSGEILFGGKPLSEAKSLAELSDLLFGAATIYGWQEEESDEDEDDDEAPDEDFFFDDGVEVAVRDVAPKTIDKFLKDCKKKALTPENLKTVVIKNASFGSGDSAKWIECDDLLHAFEKHYAQQGANRSPDKLQALMEFVKTEPVLPAQDNEYSLSGREQCVWETDDAGLKKAMEKLLKGKLSGDHWMCTYAKEYTIDVKGQTMSSRGVLFYGSI